MNPFKLLYFKRTACLLGLMYVAVQGYSQTIPPAQTLPYSLMSWTTTIQPPGIEFHKFVTSPTTRTTNNGSGGFNGTSVIGNGGWMANDDYGISLLTTGSAGVGAMVLSINTIGLSNIQVGWLARTILQQEGYDNSIALQYSIGSSGIWTNVGTTSTYSSSGNVNPHVSPLYSEILPAAADNLPLVLLRWVYWISEGSSGKYDRIAIDDIDIRALKPCAPPIEQPMDLILTSVTKNSLVGYFTEPTPHADEYLVIRSTKSTLENNPADGVDYVPGVNLDLASDGTATVIQSSYEPTFFDNNLNPNTRYYYYIFAYSNFCTGASPIYHNSPLQESALTKLGPCFYETFDDDNKPPFGWEFRFASISAGTGNTLIESVAPHNNTLMSNANHEITTPLISNPTVIEFWAKSGGSPVNHGNIKVQYIIDGVNGAQWIDVPYYTANSNENFGQIGTEYSKFIIDFEALNLALGDYWIKWIFNANPFDFYMDDMQIYCHGSTIDCPPKRVWTENSGTSGWYEANDEGVLISPLKATGPPDIDISTIIAADYDTSIHGSFKTCSLIINDGYKLEITAEENVLVLKNLEVNGNLQVYDKGSLLMVRNNGTVNVNGVRNEATNTGVSDVHKTSSKYAAHDYTYWSSPVESATVEDALIGFKTVPGTVYRYATENFRDLYDNSNGSGNMTLGSDGIDDDEPYLDWGTFLNWNPDYDWQRVTGVMKPGKGYIGMNPTEGPFTGQSVMFSGPVNNGVIYIPLTLSADDNNTEVRYIAANDPDEDNDDWNLLGNPYPSAIDVGSFLLNPINIDLLGGTLFFWTHLTEISEYNVGYNGYENFSKGDYASVNITGAVATYYCPGGENGADLCNGSPFTPEGYIASGQSFMVDAISAGNVNFTNSMRVKDHNTQFYKSSNKKGQIGTKQKSYTIEGDRIWLNLRENTGAFSQLLIGFFGENTGLVKNATDGVDRMYDGERLISGNYIDFYSVIDEKPYAIQGRTALNSEKSIPLGVNSNITGILSISISHFDGQFSEKPVYLKDNELGVMHDLKAMAYSFEITEPGTYNDRFELICFGEEENEVSLPEENEEIEEGDFDETIQFKNIERWMRINVLDGKEIKGIEVNDILGRLICKDVPRSVEYYMYTQGIPKGSLLFFKLLMEDGSVRRGKYIKL